MQQIQHVSKDTVRAARAGRASRMRAAELEFVVARRMLLAGQPEGVFAALDAVEHDLRGDECALAAILRGAALVALGRLDDGIAVLRPVVETGDERRSNEARCELAEAYLRAGRLDDAEATLSPFIDGDSDAEPHLAARGLALYGRVERGRGRRTVAARHYLDALTVLDGVDEPDDALQNRLRHDVATIAIETLDPRLFARVRRTAPTSDRLSAVHGGLQQARLLVELLWGDLESAWTIAFSAMRDALPGVPFVTSLFGVATVSRAAGDEFTALRLAGEAADAARYVDWERADGWGRRALLGIVAMLAPTNVERASRLMETYEALPEASGSREGSLGEPGAHSIARASLLGARGDYAAQRTGLKRAAATARERGDQYAEVEALLELSDLRCDQSVLRRVEELTRFVPHSPLRRRYESQVERAGSIQQLSPAEQRVMNAICQGLSTPEIATRFGRSKNTIRNQTRRVFEVMEVKTRSALVAKAAGMGLLYDSPNDRARA